MDWTSMLGGGGGGGGMMGGGGGGKTTSSNAESTIGNQTSSYGSNGDLVPWLIGGGVAVVLMFGLIILATLKK